MDFSGKSKNSEDIVRIHSFLIFGYIEGFPIFKKKYENIE